LKKWQGKYGGDTREQAVKIADKIAEKAGEVW
jgi:hypothetical protein